MQDAPHSFQCCSHSPHVGVGPKAPSPVVLASVASPVAAPCSTCDSGLTTNPNTKVTKLGRKPRHKWHPFRIFPSPSPPQIMLVMAAAKGRRSLRKLTNLGADQVEVLGKWPQQVLRSTHQPSVDSGAFNAFVVAHLFRYHTAHCSWRPEDWMGCQYSLEAAVGFDANEGQNTHRLLRIHQKSGTQPGNPTNTNTETGISAYFSTIVIHVATCR